MSKIKLEGNALGTGTITFSAPNTNTDRTITLPDADVTVGLPDAIDVDASAPADSVAIDSSGNVGIGTSSPTHPLHIATVGNTPLLLNSTHANGGYVTWQASGSNVGWIGSAKALTGGTGSATDLSIRSDANVTFTNGGTERMRIDSSGNLLVNGTSSTGYKMTVTSESTAGAIDCVGGATNGYYAFRVDMPSTNSYAVLFRTGGSNSGSITTGGGGTSYNTSSDYRLKENVVAITGATERLKQLNPVRFNFIADADTTVDGFLAHEAQEVVPEAVTGTKDAVDAQGNPDYQGIDQSKLTPLLTAALQEAIAKIEDLESRLAALETV